MRQPFNFPITDQEELATGVLAQALYVYGTIDTLNSAMMGRIKSLAGCQYGDRLTQLDVYGFLLDRGFVVCEVTTYRHELLLRHGIAYLRNNVYQGVWGEEHEAYFTQECLDDLLWRTQRYVDAIGRANPRGGKRRHYQFPYKIAPQTILSALGRGSAVQLMVRGNEAPQPVLLTPPAGMRGISGWQYNPAGGVQTTSYLQLHAVWKQTLPSEGAAVICPA